MSTPSVDDQDYGGLRVLMSIGVKEKCDHLRDFRHSQRAPFVTHAMTDRNSLGPYSAPVFLTFGALLCCSM
jgi:hypothetical protein